MYTLVRNYDDEIIEYVETISSRNVEVSLDYNDAIKFCTLDRAKQFMFYLNEHYSESYDIIKVVVNYEIEKIS